MRTWPAALLAIALALLSPAAQAADCARDGIGVSRIVEIDTAGGPLFGKLTRFAKEASFLGPKEVVLTFDDGPMPWITRSILDTLDAFCTKATFFEIGRMAIEYPQVVKEVLARGHSVGSHTWSHPLTLRRLKPEAAKDEVERGFAAVSLAAGRPIAPFFRFPGLSDNAPLLSHLQSRGVATFTVDVVSNDSFIFDAGRLIKHALDQVERQQGGILLFHDIKSATAKALPIILGALKARGYKVVHMRAKAGFEPLPELTAQLQPLLAKAQAGKGRPPTFFEGMPGRDATADAAPVTQLAPEPKTFQAAAKPEPAASEHRPRSRPERRQSPVTSGWSTTVRPNSKTIFDEF